MSKLEQFFQSQIDETFMSSDDVVHAVLPLIRQLIETHDNSQVAPMEGIDALHYEHSAIWYAIKDAIPIKLASSAIRRIDPVDKSTFRIVSESSYENDLTDGMDSFRDHSIQDRESKITSPVYLPGYICWENQLEHHDPLCDSFVLGLIIASLACNLNLNGEKDLALFVENRSNLFNINPSLDPVIAKSIVQLTELSRHDRLADLDSLYRSLKNYRDQEIDIDFELLKIQGFDKKKLDDKQQIILAKLQERLFEISRRNKLLHFSSTQQTVNLTQASVPLSCDLQHIKPESLLTWGHSFKNDILKEKPVLLNKYVNTLEALYLPGIFDRLRTEASRDQKEYGFAQLRLVLCFMSWTNLKEKSKERFYSPLVLLPVTLSKKKGIKDKYWLQALDSEAEINPVLRHQFSELFGIDLPETIDLTKTDLVSFYQWLLTKIESSDQSITLELINKPKVDIIHEAAKRRLDQYNRRAGISGRGISKYEDIDYSYSPTNFHPLGLRLFNQRIRRVNTQLEKIVGETDAIEMPYMVDTNSIASESPPEQKKTKAFYSFREDNESNPYRWQFDMCNITLGNFKYRKMSLVKDYARLIEAPRNNQAFEATFSLDPKPVENQINEPTDIAQRYHVVPCDPTQAEAIDLARYGESYIIQGPPGTGKSQTITNLIADYIAHDKKILFVCEKRAAIDIVYLRLKQQGLGAICCLIHDSQTDKKHFIMDLKATYEGFIEDGNGNKEQNSQVERNELIKQLSETLQPLKNFDKHMTQVYEASGIPLNQLLILAMQNKQHLPTFNALALEYFPNYSVWMENQPLIDKLADSLAEIQADNILLNHPLGLLHERFIELDQPMNRVTQLIGPAQKEIQLIIEGLKNTNNAINLNERDFATVRDLEQLLKYIQNVHLLSKSGLTCLFDSSHATTQQFEKTHKKYRKKIDLLEKCQSKTKHWHNKLPEDETKTALMQAKSLNGVLAFLKPGWWRLRKILNSHYDFSAHQVKPGWSQVLTVLQEEHKAQSQVLDFIDDARIDFGFDCDFNELLETVDQTKQVLTQADEKMLKLHDLLVTKNQSIETVEQYLQLVEPLERLMRQLNELLQEFEKIEFESLSKILTGMNAAVNQLPEYLLCLRCLAGLPDNLSSLFRKHRVSVKGLESAVTHKTLLHIIKTIPSLNRITSSVKNQYVKSMRKVFSIKPRISFYIK